jgi:hypothetical protein
MAPIIHARPFLTGPVYIRRGHCRPNTFLFQPIYADIDGDPFEPGNERPVFVEGVQRSKCSQKSILGDIFSITPIAEHPVSHIKNTYLVASHQDLKGIQIALSDG